MTASDGRPSIDLVVFDLGGVLVRITHGWREAHERAGLPHHPILDDAEFSAKRAELAHAHQVGRIEPAAFCSGIERISNGAYRATDAMAILDAWIIDEYPGVGAVIDAIEAAGLETAALSNTNARHWELLPPERFPAFARLRHPLASHLLGLAKPDPAIYRAAEDRLGYRGDRILFFEDTPENVDAALEAGWRAHRIDPTGDTAAQMLEVLREHGVC